MDGGLATVLDGALEGESSDFTGVIHVSRRGETLYERAVGEADRAHGIANTIETRFAMASGSKGFTALAVLSLVADGAVALDTTVRSVIGDVLPLIDPAVTVGHLLSHTSGIGDYLDEEVEGDINDYVMPVSVHRLARTADFLAVLDGFPTKFPPGEHFSYCNGGFVVLALVVEAVTGAEFHDIVQERVLDPAGMAQTAYLRSDQLPGTAALNYLPDPDGGWRTNVFHLPVRGTGDGGAYTTVADLRRFWPALLAGEIVPPAIVAEAVRTHMDVPEEKRRSGLGFWLRPDRDTVMLDGYDAGVSFRSAYDPASTLHYTVIGTTSEGAWPIVRLLDELVPGLADAL